MSSTSLSIRFAPSPQDAANATLALAPGPWGGRERLRLTIAGASLALLVLFLIAAYVWRTFGLFILRIEEVAAFAFAGAAAGWLWGRRKPQLLPADDPRLRARTVTIEDDGLRIVGEGYESWIAWTSIATIETRFDTILFTTEWKDVHFVPKGVFPTEDAADAFAAAAARRWDARARTSPARGRGA